MAFVLLVEKIVAVAHFCCGGGGGGGAAAGGVDWGRCFCKIE